MVSRPVRNGVCPVMNAARPAFDGAGNLIWENTLGGPADDLVEDIDQIIRHVLGVAVRYDRHPVGRRASVAGSRQCAASPLD